MPDRHVLTIPNWLPWRLNALLGVHWRVKHRRKRQDREMVATYASLQEIPRAQGPRRVELHFTLGPRNRAGDRDNWLKSILDALKAAGLIVDDSPQWCVDAKLVFARGAERKTTIILVDLPGPTHQGDVI